MARSELEQEHADLPSLDEVERLRLLVEASGTLLDALHLEELLPRVLELARRALLADAYALWEHDSAEEIWRVAAHSGLDEAYVVAASQAIRGGTAQVLLAEPLVVEDVAAADWLTGAHREAHEAAGTKAMLVVALRHRESVLGTLAFYYRAAHRFSDAERSAASTLANLAASAIATGQVYAAQARMAEERLLVAEASELLASSLDYETTLANVARLVVPRFADWCSIDMVQEDGSIGRLTVAHTDLAKARWADELVERYPPEQNAPYGVPNVIRTQQAELVPEISDDLLVDATKDTPELLEILRELGLRSSMCVPLVARGRALGAITFVSAESERRYEEADLAIALDLARRASVAVDNARLYRHADRSLALLDTLVGKAPVGLGFLDVELRYQLVNEELASRNGRSVADHVGATVAEVTPELAPTVEPLFQQVIETGEPLLDIELSGETPAAPGEVRHWLTSYYPVPNEAGEMIGLGVVVTDVTESREVRAAAEAAQERMAVLAEASTQLATTLDYEATLANIASLLVPRFADWYAVDVVDEDGGFRRLAVVHKDPDKAEWAERSRTTHGADPEEPEGTGRVVRTGEPVLYREVTDELLAGSTRDADHLEVLRQLGMASAMVVPLTAGGRTFGALMLVSSNPERRYDEEDLGYAQHLARRAAVAVDNARLYSAAEERAQAAMVVEHVGDGVLLVDDSGVIRPLESCRRPNDRPLGRRGGRSCRGLDLSLVGDAREADRGPLRDGAGGDQRP